MKKLIALLLVVVMAMSAMVTVAAEGTQAATSSTPEAPVYIGAQVKEGTGISAGTYSVRFVSTVSSKEGKCIGYEITATYGTNSKDVYSGEDTEGTKVYSSIKSGDDTLTADDLEKGAVGIYVMAITGVPKEEHVIFNVTAYIKYDEGGKEKILKSAAKYERYAGGEVMPLVSAYTQDFNTATTLEAAGITKAYGGQSGTPLTITDGKLNFDTTGSSSWGNSRWILVGNDVFKYAPAVYAIEMDVTFTKMDVFNFILNGAASGGKDANADRAYSVRPTMRYGTEDNFDNSPKWSAASISNAKDVFIGTGGYSSDGKTSIDPAADDTGYTMAYDPTGSSAAFKYTVIVDSSYSDGCKIDYYIDDVYLTSFVQSGDDYDVTENSALILWAQNDVGTIDNIKVSVLAQETIYSQNFDTATTAADAGVTNLYGGLMQPTIVDGKLNIPSTAWNVEDDQKVKHLSPFATLVGRNVFAGKPGKYAVEFDVEFTKLTTFGIIVNGKTTAENDTSYMRQAAFATLLRLGKGVDQLSSGNIADKAKDYDLWYRTAYFTDADTPAQTTDTKNDKLVKEIAEGATSVSVKFKVVVDSTPADGCTFSIFADGKPIYEVTMANGFDVTENSYISLWAQDTVATIDNLTVTQLYK